MRNVDKYLINILDDNLCRYIYNLRTGEFCPRGWEDSRERCSLCHQLNAKWLEAEYVEPETDWSKVKQLTKIYDFTGNMKGYFVAKYGDVIVYSVAHEEEDASLELKYCDPSVCRLEK